MTEPGKGWLLYEGEFGDFHVVPKDDAVEHTPTDCICGPDVTPMPRPDGSMAWMTSHHSLDNREATEKPKRA